VIFAVARAGRPGRRQPGTRAGGRARGRAGASADDLNIEYGVPVVGGLHNISI